MCFFLPSLFIYTTNFAWGRGGIRERKGSDLLVTPSSTSICVGCLLKNWGVKLMEDGGESGWIEQTDDGHPQKKKKKKRGMSV